MFRHLTMGGAIKNGYNATYGLTLPNTTNWTEHKTIATTADVNAKLSKDTSATTYSQVYVKNADGTQTMINAGSTAIADGIAIRTSVGQLIVPSIPGSDTHATSKGYVDTKVGTRISSVTPTTETWTFTLSDNTTVTKTVVTGVTTSTS
jgi:hypothetical protein